MIVSNSPKAIMPNALIPIATAALALAACNNASNQPNASAPAQGVAAVNSAARVAPASAPASAPAPAIPAAQPAPAAASGLAAQLQSEVGAMQSMLPIRVDQVSQITAVHVEGTEIVYTMRYAIPIPDLARVRREAQAHAESAVCANGPASTLIRSGATMRYDYTDSVGVTFNTRVASCP